MRTIWWPALALSAVLLMIYGLSEPYGQPWVWVGLAVEYAVAWFGGRALGEWNVVETTRVRR